MGGILPPFEDRPNEMTTLQLDTIISNDEVILGMYAWEWDPQHENISRMEYVEPEHRCGYIIHVQNEAKTFKMLKVSCPGYPGVPTPSQVVDFQRNDLKFLETNRNEGENIGPRFLATTLDDEFVEWDLTSNTLSSKSFVNGLITHSRQTQRVMHLKADQYLIHTSDDKVYWECGGIVSLISSGASVIGAGQNSIMFYVAEKSTANVLVSIDGYENCTAFLQNVAVASLHDDEVVSAIHGDILLTSDGRLFSNRDGTFKPINDASGMSFLSFHSLYLDTPQLVLAVGRVDRRVYYWRYTSGSSPFNKIVGSYSTPSFIQYGHGAHYLSDGAFIIESADCFNVPTNDPSVCSGHGRCIGLDQCECQAGFSGSKCELSGSSECNGISADDPNVCSGKGECHNGQCVCSFGTIGDDCAQTLKDRVNEVVTIVVIVSCVAVCACCCCLGIIAICALIGFAVITHITRKRKYALRGVDPSAGWVPMDEHDAGQQGL